jgi:hypothetical protein
MALQDGLKLRLLVDGVHQVLVNQISLEIDGKNQPLETLEGLAGKTPGAGMATITASAVVPIGGPEEDFFENVVLGSYHDLQVPYGKKSYLGTGWFDKSAIEQSTGKGTEINFTWMGEFAKPR